MAVGVLWPAWVWITHPWVQWLTLSHSWDNAVRDSAFMRQVIEDDWYQQRWKDRFQLVGAKPAKELFTNDKMGRRQALGITSKVTGKGGHCLILDDPNDTDEANSEAHRDTVISAWKEKLYNRVNDERRAVRVLIQQRCHKQDLTGYILSESNEWTHLCLPNEFVEKRRCVTVLPILEPSTGEVRITEWSDPRTEEGELLNPDRLSGSALEDMKATLGSYGYTGQYQQAPTPAEGGIIKKTWWRFFPQPESGYPPGVTDIRIFWDCAFKGTKTSDYVVGQCWGRRGPDYFLLDQVRGHWDFVETKDQARAFLRRHPKWQAVYVEAKANGDAVISELRREFPNILKVNDKIVASGKLARMYATSPAVEAGNVYLPDKSLNPWVETFIEEVAASPSEACGGDHDDQADCMTSAILTYRRQEGIPLQSGQSSPVATPAPSAGRFNPKSAFKK